MLRSPADSSSRGVGVVNESDLNACCFETSDAFGRAGSVGPLPLALLKF